MPGQTRSWSKHDSMIVLMNGLVLLASAAVALRFADSWPFAMWFAVTSMSGPFVVVPFRSFDDSTLLQQIMGPLCGACMLFGWLCTVRFTRLRELHASFFAATGYLWVLWGWFVALS